MIKKRRKSKDNPYTIIELDGIYMVKYKNKLVKINQEVYNALASFELEDISQMHKYERHIEHSLICEETLYFKMINKECSIEEYVMNKLLIENLYLAINKLPINQQRRLKLYYFYGKSLKEIAELERCSIHSIFVSINRAKEKLKKFLTYGVKN